MANVFANLPLPAGNGAGAAVDVSTMGRSRTIVVSGAFSGALITVEASVDGGVTFAPVASFQGGRRELTIDVAAEFMRTLVSGRSNAVPFSANVDVSSNDDGGLFLAIPLPAGNGNGAAVDASALGTFNTFIVGGTFAGARILVEVSEDGVGWAPLISFAAQGNIANRIVTAAWYRANVSGRSGPVPFTATLAVGAVNDVSGGGGGGGGAGVSNCLIYQPGGAGVGPGTFSSWADLVAELATLRAAANAGGCYTIQFDDSLSSPATIPAGAYDMTGVTWEGKPEGYGAFVEIANGASFTGLRAFQGNLQVTNLNTVTAAVSDIVGGSIVTLRQAVLETVTGGAPFFDCPGLGGGDVAIFQLFEASQLGASALVAGPVVRVTTAGATLFIGKEGVSNIGVAACLVGSAGTFLQFASSSLQNLQAAFANWAGSTIEPRIDVPPSLIPRPYLAAPSAASLAAVFSAWLRITTAGGNVAQTLPAISAASGALRCPGCFVLVSESSGVNRLTLAPAGGDTIQGSGAAITVPAGGAMLLAGDGISNWTIVSQWGGSRYMPPEQWAQNNIAASQTNVPLAAQVSTNFDTWQALRSGSLVGLRTRLTEAITAGTLTVQATINGVAATLQIVHTAGSNPNGAGVTQLSGIDRFVAGDLIGIWLTTTAGFLPITDDIEAYLEIEENP
jgi:hypothetical protein